MTEQDKINNLSRFEHENDLILEVGTQLGILTEDYDVVNCVVTRIDRDVNKFWITRDGSTDWRWFCRRRFPCKLCCGCCPFMRSHKLYLGVGAIFLAIVALNASAYSR
jgi:hypothetical protein